MERILIHKGKPSKVFEKDDTHYFFWRFEIGFTYIKIGNREFPVLPFKISDYEPIKTLNFNDGLVVLSRFHYHLLLFFNEPKLMNGKPVANFYFGSHSPFIYWILNDRAPPTGARIFKKSEFGSIDVDGMYQSMAFYTKMFKKAINKGKFSKLKEYQIRKGNIPPDALFEPCNSKAIIWFGKSPSDEEFQHIEHLPC